MSDMDHGIYVATSIALGCNARLWEEVSLRNKFFKIFQFETTTTLGSRQILNLDTVSTTCGSGWVDERYERLLLILNAER
jgi:hypothetical protein